MRPYHTPRSERDEKLGALAEAEQSPCHRGEQIIAEMLSEPRHAESEMPYDFEDDDAERVRD